MSKHDFELEKIDEFRKATVKDLMSTIIFTIINGNIVFNIYCYSLPNLKEEPVSSRQRRPVAPFRHGDPCKRRSPSSRPQRERRDQVLVNFDRINKASEIIGKHSFVIQASGHAELRRQVHQGPS